LRRPENRVIEALENGQEITCKEISENREGLNRMQRKILTKMELFNNQTMQDIRSTIIESNNTEVFNEFAKRSILVQENMKEFNRM
jgi:hypothetical protein